MKTLFGYAKSVVSWLWSWIVWVKAKGWAGLKASLNYTYDPPPHHVKYWMVVVLGIAVGGAWFGGAVRGWFDHSMLGQAMAPVPHVRSMPEGFLVYPSEMSAKLDAPKPADVPVPLAALKPIIVVPPVVPAQPAQQARTYRAKPSSRSDAPHRRAKPASSPFSG